MATRTTPPRKRQAQDATRKYDVAPLRRRIAALEKAVKEIRAALKQRG